MLGEDVVDVHGSLEQPAHRNSKAGQMRIASKFVVSIEKFGTGAGSVDTDSLVIWIDDPNQSDTGIQIVSYFLVDFLVSIARRQDLDGERGNAVN
jgi:hypothetical protein